MKAVILAAGVAVCLSGIASAAYVDDEFNGSVLGSHWTSYAGVTTDASTTTTITVQDGLLQIKPARGVDRSWTINSNPFIEQDAPTEPEWEVETRLADFNPALGGYGPDSSLGGYHWTKGALELFQDPNHYISLSVSSIGNGTTINYYGQSKLDPTSTDGGVAYRNEFRLDNVGPNASVWLRIRKTRDGYIGEASVDHNYWMPMTPLLRNPETSDGVINGKIRLIAATANVNTAMQNFYPVPLRYDYVRKTVLSTPNLPYANDDFDGTSAANWTYLFGNPVDPYNPVNSAYVDASSQTLVLNPGSISSGSGGSDISQSNSNQYGETGVIASQNAPAKVDFSVYTRVTPDQFLSASRYRSHGIRVWQNHNTWAGLKTLKNGNAPGNTGSRNYLEAMFESDNNTTRGVFATPAPASSSAPAPQFLRIDKRGNKFRMQYSFDEVTWTPTFTNTYPNGWVTLNTAATPNQNLKIQLFSARPPYTNGLGTVTPTAFYFIKEIDVSDVADWQLY